MVRCGRPLASRAAKQATQIRKNVLVSTNAPAATPHNCGKSNGIQAVAVKRFDTFNQ
jgi:hypothetical protein